MLRSGIYKIENLVNGKFYIGSAERLVKRKNNHLCYLRNGTHTNIKLQRAFNKYGEDYFKFSIIETCENNLLIEREQYYIDSLNPFYNICRIAGRTEGRITSEETKEKIRQARLGKKLSKEHREKLRKIDRSLWQKKVTQYSLSGDFIEKFDSVNDAAKSVGVSQGTLSAHLTGRNKTCKGYVFRYD